VNASFFCSVLLGVGRKQIVAGHTEQRKGVAYKSRSSVTLNAGRPRALQAARILGILKEGTRPLVDSLEITPLRQQAGTD
jgi:hypothetical protein